MLKRRAFALGIAAFVASSTLAVAAETPAWIQRSNEDAQPLLKVLGDFGPEFAARTGVAGYDDKVTQIPPDVNEKFRKAAGAVRDELKARLAAEKDPLVQQDLKIMIEAATLQIDSSTLNEKYLLPYTNVGQTIFFGEFNLLQDQVDEKRRPSALTRLNRYTGLEKGYTPLTEQAKAQFEAALKNKALLGPFKGQVEQDLGNTASYVDGIRKLFAKYHVDATSQVDALQKQFDEYAAWTKSTVLPKARTTYSLPPELYALALKNVGIDIDPRTLLERAQLEFMETRAAMQQLAPLVAKEKGIAATDPIGVIRALKVKQLPNDQIEPFYRSTILPGLDRIIATNRIVSLPNRPMQMRLGSDAENAAQPAPHFLPAPLVGNTGQQGTFVLPLGNPNAKGDGAYDDFNYPSAAWTLTAHEGRPGHELQFTAMVERGVSLARTLFAFNSVNVEGWALYAEAETVPYEPLDGQLIALQFRLLRAARAMLDPMLNLGLTDRDTALKVLTDQVGFSKAMARQEIDRYTVNSPGQAGSYFYGYSRIEQLRAETELALGDRFDRKAFNDFLLDQGLLPPDLLAKAVREQFVPREKARG